MILIETRNFPGAYKIRGQYTVLDNNISLKAKIFKDTEVLKTVELKGNKQNINDLVEKLVNETIAAIKL